MQYLRTQSDPYIYEALMKDGNIVIESKQELNGHELDRILEKAINVTGIILIQTDTGKEVKVTNKANPWEDLEESEE